MAGRILPTTGWMQWIYNLVIKPTPTQAFEKVTEVSSRSLLESIDTFLHSRHVDPGSEEEKYARACAQWICRQESGEEEHALVISSKPSVIKVVSNDCKLKLKELRNGGVETTITLQVESILNLASEQQVSSLLNKLSTVGCSTWTKKLLHRWAEFSNAMRPEAMNNVKLILYGEYNVRIKIRCKVVKIKIGVVNNPHEGEIVFEVDEINKRTLGRLIIWLCGNEGSSDTSKQAALRRLIQDCITLVEKQKNSCWKDTEVTILGGNILFHIRAGKSNDPTEIFGYFDTKGEFKVLERDNRFCIIL
ncbi:uncharacterized protein LOC117111683 isoform X2 [Anneissia japonica]|uniref:uncharacterized protein LOC117111683 isoform X2 n=1 Tax=Anneissia japonica TaxID=1529436 RepID=UPI0014254BC5|nr:uncharacterized protein LOC117111683 isoform X2 [Anneissia japonica]XP_033110557.1 uncharacterized protein LOC117111683 isoform X2 [Anneissia japonica]